MKPWLELLKLRITVASTVTTFVGYAMARGRVDLSLLPVLAGIMLQACGAAALNQVQDAVVDARMPRTAGRPIPSGRVNRVAALIYALLLLAAGSAVLWSVSGTAALLGLAAAVIYNGVYTPLKRVTPFAALPGSGGYLSDPTIHQVAFFFFLWQIPHFWLLLLFYEKDYADGGMPSLFDRFDRRQIVRLTFLWIAFPWPPCSTTRRLPGSSRGRGCWWSSGQQVCSGPMTRSWLHSFKTAASGSWRSTPSPWWLRRCWWWIRWSNQSLTTV